MATGRILLTGFEPFGGESTNPSWDVASRFQEALVGDLEIIALRLPVECKSAAREVRTAIARIRPVAVIGLGQAGGRTALSIEKVAINLADERTKVSIRKHSQGSVLTQEATISVTSDFYANHGSPQPSAVTSVSDYDDLLSSMRISAKDYLHR